MFAPQYFAETYFTPRYFHPAHGPLATAAGRSTPVTSIGILARFVPPARLTIPPTEAIRPAAAATTPVARGDVVTVTVKPLSPSGQAVAQILDTGAVEFDTAKLSPIAGGQVRAEGSAVGTGGIPALAPSAGITVMTVRGGPPIVVTGEQLHPQGVLNPTEEQLVAIIRQRRRNR